MCGCLPTGLIPFLPSLGRGSSRPLVGQLGISPHLHPGQGPSRAPPVIYRMCWGVGGGLGWSERFPQGASRGLDNFPPPRRWGVMSSAFRRGLTLPLGPGLL